MKVPEKWRPSLAQLIASVVAVLIILPFFALVAARITSNQFVRETEASLHAQAAIYAAQFANAIQRASTVDLEGVRISAQQHERLALEWHPVDARLTTHSRSILSPRPDTMNPEQAPKAFYLEIGTALSALAKQARKTNLVGVIALDPNGTIIGKSGKETGSLGHVWEVQRALKGDVVSVARWREEEYRNHSLKSLSRDTQFRVYVAHPVIVADHVVGAVYLSRTPSNLNKYLFQHRHTIMWLMIGVFGSAALIGAFLWLFLSRPIHQLQAQAHDISTGKTETRLPQYGVKELAGLGQSLINMGETLSKNAAALQPYTKHATHELKSPVTSIMGAAELLEADTITDQRRAALATTIKADAARMNRLLNRMREMANGQIAPVSKPATLAGLHPSLEGKFAQLTIEISGNVSQSLPLSHDAAIICLGHLLENAAEHEAKHVKINFDDAEQTLCVHDNGSGISAANAPKATEPFFTTRREEGGTGMGLAICAEIVGHQGGQLEIGAWEEGTMVTISF